MREVKGLKGRSAPNEKLSSIRNDRSRSANRWRIELGSDRPVQIRPRYVSIWRYDRSDCFCISWFICSLSHRDVAEIQINQIIITAPM